MTPRASQIRTYRILGCLAVLHSGVVLGLLFGLGPSWGIYPLSGLWLVLASSLFLWLLALAIHPGRSIRRFLIPTVIATALFVPCAPLYGVSIYYCFYQWRAADKVEGLLRSNPRMVLYSINAEYRKPLELKKGYRQVGPDEIILPDDLFDNSTDSFVRMDEAAKSLIKGIANSLGQTVKSIADENVRSEYGRNWQLLRKEPNGSTEPEPEKETPPDPRLEEFDREPYKGPAVLGYAEITDRAEQWALIAALARSATHAKGGALCHVPRHGLYIETGTFAVSLSICFECQNVYVSNSDAKTGPLVDVYGFDITPEPASIFNTTLKRHGIPVAPARAH